MRLEYWIRELWDYLRGNEMRAAEHVQAPARGSCVCGVGDGGRGVGQIEAKLPVAWRCGADRKERTRDGRVVWVADRAIYGAACVSGEMYTCVGLSVPKPICTLAARLTQLSPRPDPTPTMGFPTHLYESLLWTSFTSLNCVIREQQMGH